MKLDNSSVAIVTGGASGLGGATAKRLYEAGACVVLLDLPTSGGEAAAEALGERARFVAADVRDEEQVQGVVDRAKELGELRVAVNCAGIGTPGRIIGRKGPLPLEKFRTVIEVNLIGTFNVMRLAANAMLENEPVEGERGVVINTASIAGYDGQIGRAAYASSKGGVIGLTLTSARDLADKQIRVMTIAPGTFETPMLAGLPEDARKVLEEQVPHPSRLGNPAEYAALALHIVENPMLNGEVIRLDGALRMPPA